MRFTLATVLFAGALSASAVTLQARQSFPDCANSCVVNPKNTYGCSAVDDGCLCRSQQYVADTTQCIVSACSAADAASAEALSRQLCAAVGVTLTATPTLAPSGSDTSSSGPSTSAPAPSSISPSGSGSATSGAPTTTQTTNGAVSNNINILGAAAAMVAAVFTL